MTSSHGASAATGPAPGHGKAGAAPRPGLGTEQTIRIDHITKVYHLYARHSDRMKEALHPLRRKYHQEFFALDDVTFAVNRGEALGILGRNGSGKSTLLKIVTGVLTPTSGHVHLQGKISALLELGTGFNPDLTGLQNIYFSGTILGRERADMARLVPDILAFADIGPHIDQPVKTYSSGMFARLAFAVAVNVDPDILIVDEALSVGDMRFQQKCIRKMQGFRDQGKTILFVSHDMGVITTFCDRALWLDQGRIRQIGPADEVCKRYAAYMTYGEENPLVPAPPREDRLPEVAPDTDIPWIDLSDCESFGDGGAVIQQAALLDAESGAAARNVRPCRRLRLAMRIRALRPIQDIGFGILVKNQLGQALFGLNNWLRNAAVPRHVPDGALLAVTFDFQLPGLSNGTYSISLAVGEGSLSHHTQHHWVHDALFADVVGLEPECAMGWTLTLPRDHWDVRWTMHEA